MDLKETGCDDVEWISMTQSKDSMTCCCECGDEPSNSAKGDE
jgi:hypothetical protein